MDIEFLQISAERRAADGFSGGKRHSARNLESAPSLGPVEVDLHFRPCSMTRAINRRSENAVSPEIARVRYVAIGRHRHTGGVSGYRRIDIADRISALREAGVEAIRYPSFAPSSGGFANKDTPAEPVRPKELAGGEFEQFPFAAMRDAVCEAPVKIIYHYSLLRGQRQRRLPLAGKRACHCGSIEAVGLTRIDYCHVQFGLSLSGFVYHANTAILSAATTEREW